MKSIGKTCLLVSLLLLAWAGSLRAQSANTLFDISAGTRPLAMGGAFTGLADDENALFYNAAGLALLDQAHLGSLLENHLGLASYGSAALGLKHLGLALRFFSLGNIERRDAQDNAAGSFGYSNLALTLGGGLRLNQLPLLQFIPSGLAMGLRLQFLRVSTLAPGSGSGFALDPSWLYDSGPLRLAGLQLRALRLGLALDNLLNFGVGFGSGHREGLPLGARLGFALLARSFSLDLDLGLHSGFHLGGEYRLALPLLSVRQLALRLGIFDQGVFSFTLGFGVQVFQGLQIDYAFSSHPRLGLGGSHRLGFSYRFAFSPF
ncbi:MAG TPA: hypothetical protein ENI60_08420 [Candidatus Fraserbacteria bacterium]|nr:hypothetical protein [Candidatus Fraserbacteria bacterium]